MQPDSIRRLLFRFGLVLLSIFSTAVARASAEPGGCKAQPELNPLVKGRAQRITFPDGRVLTVVGHIHGDRQIYQISRLVQDSKLASLSNTEFTQMLEKIRNENRAIYQGNITRSKKRETVEKMKKMTGFDTSDIYRPEEGLEIANPSVEKHALEDYLFILRSVQPTNSKIQFIGYEGTAETWEQNLPYYRQARTEVLNQLAVRQRSGVLPFSRDDVERILLSSSNGNVYAMMANRSISEKVAMVGTEDPAAGLASKQSDDLRKMDEALASLVREDDTYWDSKSENEKEEFKKDPRNSLFGATLSHLFSEVQFMTIGSYAEFDRLVQIVREKSPMRLQASIESLIVVLKERMRINFARDLASAKNLAQRYETGIHFVGLNHYKNTVANLEKLCQQEQAQSSYPMTPASNLTVK